METRINNIVAHFDNIDFVKIVQQFTLDKTTIKGEIAVSVENITLSFLVEIHPQYPFQYHDIETIRFINKELLRYNHVNSDGSICVHTLHSPDLKTKIELDLFSLKHWIIKYYISKATDSHYEHIMVVPAGYGKNQVLWFTDINHQFTKGNFGQFNFSYLAAGIIKNDNAHTYIIQNFKIKGKQIECSWNSYYKKLELYTGIYLFLDLPPVKNKRFAVTNWQELEPFVSQDFLKYLYDFESGLKGNRVKYDEFKLIVGYNINEKEVHWQSISIKKDDFPHYAEKVEPKTYVGKFYDKEINWMETRNCSPQYFFGRGALNSKITESKILIIGIGAVGSVLSTTLVRGGCTDIFLNDHDVKEPENICRSEYQFFTGMTSKVYELRNLLMMTSPFVEINGDHELTDIIKLFHGEANWKETLEDAFNRFDIIFDCTTDNDLAYILSLLNIRSNIINLSITNHAKELVVVSNDNLYKWLTHIFSTLNSNSDDLYNPTGCWSPTFKAGYNDISVLVQYAIKQINLTYDQQKPLRNFYLSTSIEDEFKININQF